MKLSQSLADIYKIREAALFYDSVSERISYRQTGISFIWKCPGTGEDMIGKLKGIIDSSSEDYLILDVHGVGYIIFCSAKTLQKLPAMGEPAELLIETHVREDMIRLYGFQTEAERGWFRLLMSVQGVGAKVALGLLGIAEPAVLAHAIAGGDKGTVSRGPGIGPKLAQRIVSELKDKVHTIALPQGMSGETLSFSAEDHTAPGAAQDAVSALVNLGYGRPQAAAAIAAAVTQAGDEAETGILIRLGLKELAR